MCGWSLGVSFRSLLTVFTLLVPPSSLDSGTGSSCIYPLLGCRSLPSLTFVATDIDEHSLSYARHNVTANQLSDRIDLRHVGQDDGLFPSGE